MGSSELQPPISLVVRSKMDGQDDKNDIYLSHEFRLALTKPVQSSFRVLALLFYEEEEDGDKSKSRLPPWIKHETNSENGKKKRSYIVGTNDEPGNALGSICAERAAMVQLRFVPSFKVTKLVIATDATEPIACGMLCREFLAGHTSVPWDLKIVSTACQCERCDLTDEALFLKKQPCREGYAEHSIPTLHTTLKELYPYPSPFTRLTAKESAVLGEQYSESSKSTRDVEGLSPTATRLLELAILEAKSNLSDNHPIQFGAAAILEDETIVTSHQTCALEYGCSLDAVSQLAPYFKEKESRPVLLVQADQFGISHAPFAPARAFLSENGFEECLVLLHSTPNLDNVSEDLQRWKLEEVLVADLAPNAPDWKTSLHHAVTENNRAHEEQKRKKPPSRESSHDNILLQSPSSQHVDGDTCPTINGAFSPTIQYAPLALGDSSSTHKEKLKIVSQDLVNKFNESRGSFSSELSQMVNDSARGVSFEDVYDKQDVLGEGGFAYVYRCVHKERQMPYAVKEVFSENYETPGQSMREEISSLKRLKEIPYIVRLLDVFRGPESTHLVMEEMKGGDLLDKLYEKEVFSEEESRRISRRLLEAVFFCHKKGIAHRDIKPENILLVDKHDDTKIKLGDFGCAHPIDGKDCLHTMCGSPQYVAPEIYQHVYGYDEKCDLWSVGVVIFVILGGYAPFEAPESELPGLICDGYFRFDDPEWTDITVAPKLLIKRLLVVDPDERASIEEALDSEWLKRRDKELAKQHCSTMDGSSASIAFDAWVKLSKNSNHSIARYASGILEGDNQEEDEFGGEENDDSLSVDELKTSIHLT